MTDWPKRGSLSLTEVKAVAPIHGSFFVFISTNNVGSTKDGGQYFLYASTMLSGY